MQWWRTWHNKKRSKPQEQGKFGLKTCLCPSSATRPWASHFPCLSFSFFLENWSYWAIVKMSVKVSEKPHTLREWCKVLFGDLITLFYRQHFMEDMDLLLDPLHLHCWHWLKLKEQSLMFGLHSLYFWTVTSHIASFHWLPWILEAIMPLMEEIMSKAALQKYPNSTVQ